VSPPEAACVKRGVSAALQGESEARTVKVLSPIGVPLPDRITRADAINRISLGLAENITETFRKQVGAIRLLANCVTPKTFGTDHFMSGRDRYAKPQLGNDASKTIIKQRGIVTGFHGRVRSFGRLPLKLVTQTKGEDAFPGRAIVPVGKVMTTSGVLKRAAGK
jgi:hypothetical protein